MKVKVIRSLCISLLSLISASALSAEVNVYSARSEALIKPLLEQFTADSGVKVNLITGKADLLITRMQREGKFSKADVLITTDVGRLYRAESAALLQPMDMKNIESLVPTHLRDPEANWVALTTRARPIMYLSDKTDITGLSSIFDLADPKWKGRVCIRSSSNIYNQSMVAAMIEQYGEEKVQQWANAFVGHFARSPKGGDRDQIKAMVAGECDIAVANTYYLAGMAADSDEKNASIANQVSVLWPDQASGGAHVNISGVGIAKHSKNTSEAQALVEFMLTEKAQQWYAKDNQEYPVVAGVPWSNTLTGFGQFVPQSIPLEQVGKRNAQALKLMDRAGWK